jgi:signal transduction histidine kinase
MTDAPPLSRRLSLRTRMVLIGAIAITVVLTIGGAVLWWAFRAALIDEAVATNHTRARDIAMLASAEALPETIPATNEGELIGVLGPDGRPVASTPSADLRSWAALRLPTLAPGQSDVLHVGNVPVGDVDVTGVVARGAATPSGPVTVYVAVPTEEISETLGTATQVGLAVLPILVVLLSVGMWYLIGRTLESVETIRREADAISGRHLDRRVSEPTQHDEIGRLARTVNAMLARLQDSVERQRRFVADAAHELRSPIASLRTQLETARESKHPVDWRAVSGDLLDETVRMQQLAEQLLLLARADAGTLEARRAPVDLDDVVDTVVERLPRDSAVNVDRSAIEPVQVTGDPLLLEQVVRNLLDNAVRHADREVRVALSRADGHAVLTVDDDGPGIPPDRRQEAFERFARLDGARDRDTGGAGLGLAITADIVRAHDGQIDVSDAPLGGARFLLRLPVATAASDVGGT